MAEDGESPGIVRANGLRQEAASGLAGMRANVVGNALGGQGDPRSRIEADLEAANTQLAEAQRRISGASREPVAQTPAGEALLKELKGEVGYVQKPPTEIPVTQANPPKLINRVQKIFNLIRGK